MNGRTKEGKEEGNMEISKERKQRRHRQKRTKYRK
jgi:hypothetical protein